MPMGPASILVGRRYRTAEGEVRRVRARQDDQVVFDLVAAPRGPGMLAQAAARRLPLERFAQEVESDVTDNQAPPHGDAANE